MKDDIRRAFDGSTDAPHPSLRSALRARLEAGQAQEPPRAWRMMVATALVAGVVGLAFIGGVALLPRGGGGPAPAAATSPTPTTEPTATPSTSTAVSPSPSSTAYWCGSSSGGGPAGTTANVRDVRVGTGTGYDRFVIEFDGPVPQYSVEPQGAPTFMQDASGQNLVLLGQSGIRVVIKGATAYANGAPTYAGPTDFKPGYKVLAEARQVGDFERVYSWGLGLNLAPRGVCTHVFTLSGPDRLVIDIQQP